MKIAIDLNDVVRDIFTKSIFIYEKYYIENDESEQKISEYNEETEEWENKEENNSSFKYELNLPIDSTNLINHFKFPTEDDLYNFFYIDFPMQIFGHSSSTSANTFNIINDLYINYRDDHDLTIISDEMGKSKPATLFFLSKYGCLFENISFYSNMTVDKIIDEFDIILTANPNILQNSKQKTIIVKYNTEYNKDFDSDYEISSLDCVDEIIDKIIKKY